MLRLTTETARIEGERHPSTVSGEDVDDDEQPWLGPDDPSDLDCD